MSDDLIQSVEEMSSTLLTIEKVLDIEKIKKEISDLAFNNRKSSRY